MKSIQQKTLLTVSSLAMLLALGACGRNDDRTAGQKMDSAVSKTEQTGAEVKKDTKEAGNSAADATKQMGANASDKVDDATITTKVNAELARDKDLSAIRIDVDTKDGVVTLSGPAPSVTARERASELARTVKGVSSVNNQLTLKAG
jgi:hyperosmotically inducible protein